MDWNGKKMNAIEKEHDREAETEPFDLEDAKNMQKVTDGSMPRLMQRPRLKGIVFRKAIADSSLITTNSSALASASRG